MLARWLKEGTTPETISVLVHDRYQRDRVVNGLGDRGIAVRAIDRDRVQPGRPVVMTMHRAKGTDFAKVVLVGVGAQTPAEAERLAAMDEAERAVMSVMTAGPGVSFFRGRRACVARRALRASTGKQRLWELPSPGLTSSCELRVILRDSFYPLFDDSM